MSVYTPFIEFDPAPEAILPVMVFIHGGGLFFGMNSLANGFFLMDHDVILVAINYRLGNNYLRFRLKNLLKAVSFKCTLRRGVDH